MIADPVRALTGNPLRTTVSVPGTRTFKPGNGLPCRMRTHRPLALLVGVLLLVVLTTGVAAAQGGSDIVGVLERLVDLLQSVIEFLRSMGSTT